MIRSSKVRLNLKLIAIASILPIMLGGCSWMRGQTPTTGLTASSVKTSLCSLWIPVTYDDTRDSSQTVTEAQVNNAKRDAFCAN